MADRGTGADLRIWSRQEPSPLLTDISPMDPVRKFRARAFFSQRERCCYCGCQMWLDDNLQFRLRFNLTPGQSKDFRCTAEHVVARRDGGKTSATNIAAACYRCNHGRHARKKSLSVSGYSELVAKRIRKGGWHVLNVLENGLLRVTRVKSGAS